MSKRRWLHLAAATCFSLAAATALADEPPSAEPGPARLQLSLVSPVQLVPESKDVSGLRLTLFYGKNAGVSGLDIAAGGTSSGTFSGVQLALFANVVEGKATGVQAGLFGNVAAQISGAQIGGLLFNVAREGGTGVQLGVSNFAGGEFTGVQIGLIGNAFRSPWATLSVTGVQVGAFNFVNGEVTGLQIGAINGAAGEERGFTGVQVGALNVAKNCRGLQLGLVNLCGDMRGVQIGLINFIRQGAIPWLPIVNAKF